MCNIAELEMLLQKFEKQFYYSRFIYHVQISAL